ncbi:hypothetical protein K457DRAFT_21290 [Linnemannia elongata AG-77]|uniref:Uncharacterized protein n=1 Tax=Linnemannia elongata AG-77 TaxID=1314771 RepID=A0A197JQ59_9FUNG|nr:hypothetical protein K457DRAFT_21290 [Linnemannia elongata AG-77]
MISFPTLICLSFRLYHEWALSTSIRELQVLRYAILICILVGVSLALGGHTRFVRDVFVSNVPPDVTNLLGSLPRSWIYPSLSLSLHEALSNVLFRGVIQKLEQFKRANQTSIGRQTPPETCFMAAGLINKLVLVASVIGIS